MEVRYFDILSFLRKNTTIGKPLDKFVSAFILNTLYDYQLRNSRIFSYVWLDLNDNMIDLHDVQKWIEHYCILRENSFVSPEFRTCVNMIKALDTLCCGD